MKKTIVCMIGVAALAGCSGINYKSEVYEKDGMIWTETERNDSNKDVCFEKAKIDAQNNISNWSNINYGGTSNLTRENESEDLRTVRQSETNSLFSKAKIEKSWDAKNKTCHIRMSVPTNLIKAQVASMGSIEPSTQRIGQIF